MRCDKALLLLALLLFGGCAVVRPTDVRIDPGPDRAKYDADLLACWQETSARYENTWGQIGATAAFGIVGALATRDGDREEQHRADHERRAEACMESRGYTVKRP